jgi:hypothetical protein
MMHDDEPDDPKLTRLLQAVRADADPALWTRVRARIEARPRVPRLLAWAMRPAALAASVALFLASMAGALVLATDSSVAGEDYATLTEALVAERDAETAATPAVVSQPGSGAAQDSGSSR